MRSIDKAGLRAPAAVVDLHLDAAPNERMIDTSRYETMWCLARSNGVPTSVTCWDVSEDATVSHADLLAVVRQLPAGPDGDLELSTTAPTLEVSVAICTRDRPTDLRRALESLRDQTDTDFSVVVVDNAPTSTAAKEVVDDVALPRCTYLLEAQGGLSRARNTALAHVQAEIVAWMDDDERADVDWVRRVKQGFGHVSQPAAVCGLMLPAELETEAQVRFEQYGGFNKGRGLATEVLSVARGTVRSPLYPLPGFGAGGNMAFRSDALRAAGAFDPLLGPGTMTRNGEETRALAMVLRHGGTVLHWPAAITWHFHRRSMTELHTQLTGYGAGLSAFFMSMLVSDRATAARELLTLVPTAARDMWPRQGNIRTGGLPEDFPADLASAPRRGFLRGGTAYVRELWAARAAERR